MNNKKKKGFTLIELLVVIAILAILATVSIVGYTSFLNKARMSVDQQLTDQINNVIAAESVIEKPETYDDVVDILTENGYTSPLVPSYSKYVFAYLANENVMVLVENGAVVYPEKYAGTTLENVDYAVNTNAALDAALALEGNVTIESDINYATYAADGSSNNQYIEISGVDKTITIGAGKTYAAGGNSGAFRVTNGGTLTLDGAGNVHADLGTSDLSMAVWARNEATIYIKDGYYTNSVTADGRSDLIYASGEGKIYISGGKFKSTDPAYTLNCRNDSNATITVTGGMFYQFDPSNNTVGEGEIIVPETHGVLPCNENGEYDEAGEWYKVMTEAEVEAAKNN